MCADRVRRPIVHLVGSIPLPDAESVFRTGTVIPRMDGKRDYRIRSMLRMFGDSALWLHYGQFSGDSAEHLEFRALLLRDGPARCSA